MTERWRSIDQCPGYEVSDMGRVRSYLVWRGNSSARFVRATKGSGGYHRVTLMRPGPKPQFNITLHRLVLTTFAGQAPRGCTDCAHLNGDKSDNRLVNLVWATRAENEAMKVRHGTDWSTFAAKHPEAVAHGERHKRAKLTDAAVIEIRRRYQHFRRGLVTQLAREFGVSRTSIRKAALAESWKHLPLEQS